MKKTLYLFIFVSSLVFAQKPAWVNDPDYYPKTQYLTGLAMNVGAESPTFIQSLKAGAKSELIEGIQVSVKSLKEFYKSERAGAYSEDFQSMTSSFADADINGLKIEYYYDKGARTGYAFAYADKGEVKGYYKANISFIIKRIETAIGDAQQFASTGNKLKAKKAYEEILPLFKDLNFAQSLLIAIEGDEPEEAQIPQSLSLQSQITQAISGLQTAIIVYVKSSETIFGQPVQILAPKLKSELSKHGCSFTPSPKEADWILNVEASTRKGSNVDGMCFSFLDVEVSLVERLSGKEIYGNNFTDLKGGALDYERAGRKAYDNGMEIIAKEIVKSLAK